MAEADEANAYPLQTPTRRHFLMSSVISGAALVGAGRGWAQPMVAEEAAARPAIADWTAKDIPSQKGRTIIVTGGNGFPEGDRSGLGYHVALELAAAGGNVIIASRNAAKGAEAIRRIKERAPAAQIRFERLDLADLSSVKDCARRIAAREKRIDTLINNAGIMGRLQRETSADGYERVFATNTLGQFALTAQLLSLLRRGRDPRVVFVASNKANSVSVNFDDLQAERQYDQDFAYSQTKLASLLLAFEMQRRSGAGQWGIASLAAHPGVSRTSLIPDGPGLDSRPGQNFLQRPEMFQPSAIGALPTLYAATAAAAAGGEYYGPRGPREMSGLPNHAKVPAHARDAQVASRLWAVAEQLTRSRLV